MSNKIKSLVKKAKNLTVKGYNEGKRNYKNKSMESIAADRAKVCNGCDQNVEEPIEELQVPDTIECIHNKMCNVCGCSLPYLLRQNEKNCSIDKW